MKDNIIVKNICEYIKGKIMSKEIFPGYRIVEDEIAKELGVSRTPLRSAFSQLQYEGFLDIIPNRGTFVIKHTQEDIDMVYEARACLEERLALGIISNVTPDDITELKENYYKQIELIDHFSIVDYSILNREFHMRLVAISNNKYLKKYVEEIYNRILVFLVYYDNSVNNSGSIVTHAAIIDALEKRDIDLLIQAIKDDTELSNTDVFKSRSLVFPATNLQKTESR